MRILIIKLSALGDVVQSLAVATAISKQRPDWTIDWAVEEPASGILMGHPSLHKVLVSPRHQIKREKSKVLKLVGGFVKELRAQRYDVALDLQGLMKSAMVCALCRAGRKIGFTGGKEPLAAFALNHKLPAFDPDRHALERYLDILAPLGLDRPDDIDYGLSPTEEEAQKATQMLEPLAASHGLIMVHPMAKWESKLWPAGHWVKALKLLVEAGAGVVLSGSPADRAHNSALVRESGLNGKVLDLSGKTSLRELAAVAKLCDMALCTDTGVMHLAAAVGTKVVALFGPTAPWRMGPYGKGHTVLRAGLDCSPCHRRQCDDLKCMRLINPQNVAETCLKELAGKKPGRMNI